MISSSVHDTKGGVALRISSGSNYATPFDGIHAKGEPIIQPRVDACPNMI